MNRKTLCNDDKSLDDKGRPSKGLYHLSGATALALAFGFFCLASPLPAQDKPDKEASGSKGAGIYFNAEASSKDVGLPIYPGARPHKEKEDDSTSAKFGLWGSSFAFKLAVLKLESNDSPEKVATFYRKALAKYGTVLDCGAASSQGEKNESESSKKLSCEADKPKPGGMELKAGTKEKQHVVGIEPNGNGTVFQFVYVESPDSDKKKWLPFPSFLVGEQPAAAFCSFCPPGDLSCPLLLSLASGTTPNTPVRARYFHNCTLI